MSSLRETIKSVNDHKSERVEVPEWGVTIFLRSLTGRQRDQFEQDAAKGKVDNARARVVVGAAYDEHGQPVFVPGDADWLAEKNAQVLDRLAEKVLAMSGITAPAAKSAEGN